jgi:CDP-4-dehydro-6-deoxyglucose reductase, E1
MPSDVPPASPRQAVLDSCQRYFDSQAAKPFVPGQDFIPVSGKVLDAGDLQALVDASLDLWLTTGRFADQFEAKLAARFGVRFARLTVSGSAANLIALSALTSPKLHERRLAPGSEVITVAAGFPTTVAPIIQNRCTPVFVDVDLATANVDVDRLAQAISPRTKAIVLAHTLGNPFAVEQVEALADKHDLYLIEDCCDAFGATAAGRPVGNWGDLATLSFYPAHQITTGEGGAVMTNRKSYATLIESFRDWGRDCWCAPGMENTCGKRFDWQLGELPAGYDHKYIYSHLGYNLKMTDMQAALGVSQLAKLDGFVARRRENFAALTAAFRSEGLEEHFLLPQATPNTEPSWFGYLMTIRDGSPLKRREVIQYLDRKKIGVRLLFGGNLTRQPAFEGVDYKTVGPLTNTDKLMNDAFWIGVWPGIGPAQRAYMIETMVAMVRELAQ